MAGVDRAAGADKLKVFISYSREDLDFADQLHAALAFAGHEPRLDHHGISGGEEWQQRLGTLIREADTIAFVLSPASARSEICAWEVEEAARLGKRIIPVLCRPLGEARAHQRLADLNYIYFYAEAKSPGAGFGTGIVRLDEALKTDIEWLREHTRLLQRASEWARAGRPDNRLLSGSDIAEAKAWAARRPPTAPEPTALHLDYLRASEDAEGARHSAERRRLEEMAKAQADRERALAEKEEATRQRSRLRIGAFAALSVIAALAVWQWQTARSERAAAVQHAAAAQAQSRIAAEEKVRVEAEKTRAVAAQSEAERAAKLAIASRQEAQLLQSKYLAGLSLQETREGRPTIGLLLALEAVRDAKSDDEVVRSRPVWAPAELALAQAWISMPRHRILRGHSGDVSGIALTADGTRIVSGGNDGIRIWDADKGRELAFLPSKGVTRLAVTADGARIASGHQDGSVRIWDAAQKKELALLKGHTRVAYSVAMSVDGTRVVSGSADGTARVWELNRLTGAPSSGGDGETWSEVAVLKVEAKSLVGIAVAISADGRRLAVGGPGSTFQIWDFQPPPDIHSSDAERPVWRMVAARRIEQGIFSIGMTPDGTRIVTGPLLPSRVTLWQTAGSAGGDWKIAKRMKRERSIVGGVGVTPDGAWIAEASDSGGVLVGDGSTEVELGTGASINSAASIAISSKGRRVVAGDGDGLVHIWDLKGDDPTGSIGTVFNMGRGHTSAVPMPDGARLVSGDSSGTLHLWNARTGQKAGVLRRPIAGEIQFVGLAYGKPLVFTAHDDLTVRLQDPATGTTKAILRGQSEPVRKVFVSLDMTLVLSSDDDTTRIWRRPEGGSPVTELNIVAELKAKYVGIAGDPHTGSWFIFERLTDHSLRIRDGKTGAELFVLKGHTDPVVSLEVLPDGRLVTSSQDHTARIWDGKTGAELVVLKGHTDAIICLSLLPNGRLGTGSSDNSARVWDTKTGAELTLLKGHTDAITSLSVLPDGRLVTGSWDRTARIWNATTGAELLKLSGHSGSVTHVAALDDGLLVTGSIDKTVRIWDATTGAELSILKGHTDAITSILVLPDRRLVTVSRDNTLRTWDTSSGAELTVLKGNDPAITSLALSTDGRWLFVGTESGLMQIRDAADGADLAVLTGHTGRVRNMAVLPSVDLVTISDDGTTRIWRAPATGTSAAKWSTIAVLRTTNATIVGDPRGGQWFIADRLKDHSVRIWDAKTGAERALLQGHTSWVSSLSALAGDRLVTSSLDNTVRLWDATTGVQLSVLKGHMGPVTSFAVLPDGRLVTGSDDNEARIWDTKTGAELAKLSGHSGSIIHLATLLDGRLVTVSHDETARIWDTKTGAEMAKLEGLHYFTESLAELPGGRLLANSVDNIVRIWELPPHGPALIDQAKAVVSICLPALERARFFLAEASPGWCAAMQKRPYDRVSVARAHLRARHYTEAVAAFTSAIALDPAARANLNAYLAEAHNGVAWTLLIEHKAAGALADAELAVSLARHNAHFRDTRGQIYLALGRVDEALTDLEQAIAEGIRTTSTYYSRGRCHETKGNREAATADYWKALEIRADDDYAKGVHAKARERLVALGVPVDQPGAQQK